MPDGIVVAPYTTSGFGAPCANAGTANGEMAAARRNARLLKFIEGRLWHAPQEPLSIPRRPKRLMDMGELSVLQITPWERSALQSLAAGASTAELASHLGLPERELQQQLTALFRRMGAASRNDAVTAAWRRGLIPIAPILGV
jgi:DNA-binding NarL/FixJ family response regulator